MLASSNFEIGLIRVRCWVLSSISPVEIVRLYLDHLLGFFGISKFQSHWILIFRKIPSAVGWYEILGRQSFNLRMFGWLVVEKCGSWPIFQQQTAKPTWGFSCLTGSFGEGLAAVVIPLVGGLAVSSPRLKVSTV